jgi:hypothetical protein
MLDRIGKIPEKKGRFQVPGVRFQGWDLATMLVIDCDSDEGISDRKR